MQLRQYQQEAVDAVYRYLRERDDNPVVVIPTAGGKTPCLATICRDAVARWDGRVLVLSHVKELLQQAVDKLKAVCPDLAIGLYSAGLGKRDTRQSVIVAGIQSVYQRAVELGAFDLILIDECHLLPPEGEGRYRRFLADARTINPQARLVGFTATPFRMDSGPICSPDGLLNHVCYEISVRQLINDGYLSPLVTKAGASKVDTSKLLVRAGEFAADEVEQLMNQAGLVQKACQEIVTYTADRNKCLIFAASVAHAKQIVKTLATNHGIECGFVCGNTPGDERAELIARFRNQSIQLFATEPLKYMVHIDVLSVGFDCPPIDCIVLLRPSNSAGWYYQAVGRGFRIHPDKANCLVLDYGNNVLRHGPVDQLRIKDKRSDGSVLAPAKECPECNSIIASGFTTCPDCSFEFPPPERQEHSAEASSEGILSGQITKTIYEVRDVAYFVHRKRDADEDAPRTMRVEYQVGLNEFISEWICVEHTGYAHLKAANWWRQRSPDPVPESAERAVELAEAGAVAPTLAITVRSVAGEQYDRIIDYELGPLPDPVGVDNYDSYGGIEDIPF